MRNTPKGLNEELNRMKKLMTFNVSENSHDVLSENFVKKSTISEQYDQQQRIEDDTAVSKALQCARTTGIPVISIRKTLVPKDFEQEPLKRLFYNNFVTLTDGLRPNALTTIDTNIQRIIDRLARYNVKPEDVTITINSSADANPAKNDPYDKKGATKIDHNYGGENPNNEYLAKMRGENLGKYLSTKIPGIKITYNPKVSTEIGEEHIFAKFIGKFDVPTYEDKTTHNLRIGWNLNGYYQSTSEWNKNHASPDCKDVVNCGCKLNNDNEFFSNGPGRVLSIPATEGSVAYSFVGQTDLIPEKTVNEVETTCKIIPGINGKIGKLGGPAQYAQHTHVENVEAYLVSSGYFTKEEATKIVGNGNGDGGLLANAAPRDGSDDGNTISKLGTKQTTMEVSTEGWKQFLKAFGKTVEFDGETLSKAIKNGAIVIRYDEDDHGVVESAGKCR